MQYIRFLTETNTSVHNFDTNQEWSLPGGDLPGKWKWAANRKEPIMPSRNGVHVLLLEGPIILYAGLPKVYLAEVGGDVVEKMGIVAAEKVRLLQDVTPDDKDVLKLILQGAGDVKHVFEIINFQDAFKSMSFVMPCVIDKLGILFSDLEEEDKFNKISAISKKEEDFFEHEATKFHRVFFAGYLEEQKRALNNRDIGQQKKALLKAFDVFATQKIGRRADSFSDFRYRHSDKAAQYVSEYFETLKHLVEEDSHKYKPSSILHVSSAVLREIYSEIALQYDFRIKTEGYDKHYEMMRNSLNGQLQILGANVDDILANPQSSKMPLSDYVVAAMMEKQSRGLRNILKMEGHFRHELKQKMGAGI